MLLVGCYHQDNHIFFAQTQDLDWEKFMCYLSGICPSVREKKLVMCDYYVDKIVISYQYFVILFQSNPSPIMYTDYEMLASKYGTRLEDKKLLLCPDM